MLWDRLPLRSRSKAQSTVRAYAPTGVLRVSLSVHIKGQHHFVVGVGVSSESGSCKCVRGEGGVGEKVCQRSCEE